MSKKCIGIPTSFQNAFFFPCDHLFYCSEKDLLELAETPFLVDILVIRDERNIDEVDFNKLIQHIFKLWKLQKAELSKHFKVRDRRSAKPLMVEGIGWFVNVMFWTNDTLLVRLTGIIEDCSQLPLKPMNVNERLAYILQVPDQFHAFIQLSELYEELEKQWYIANRKKQHIDKN